MDMHHDKTNRMSMHPSKTQISRGISILKLHVVRMPPAKFRFNLTFVWFDSLRPSQQFFSYVGTGLPGMNQY